MQGVWLWYVVIIPFLVYNSESRKVEEEGKETEKDSYLEHKKSFSNQIKSMFL